MTKSIVTIGNPLVDIIAKASSKYLETNGLTEGSMTLVDHEEIKSILDTVEPHKTATGGSAANTAAIAANLGADISFIGMVANDELGFQFSEIMTSMGVKLPVERTAHTPTRRTGSCVSLITPNAQRTMCTHLGVSALLDISTFDKSIIENAGFVFLEGYLLDSPRGQEICNLVAQRAVSGDICLTLSDPGLVDRHREYVIDLVNECDIVFANAEELKSLYQTDDIEDAIAQCAQHVDKVICTDGANGAYFRTYGRNSKTDHIPAYVVDAIDTTGAGDSFAGTVLWALANDRTLEYAIKLGQSVAAKIVATDGAHPNVDLRQMLQDQGYDLEANKYEPIVYR